jgi:hypothetical protein
MVKFLNVGLFSMLLISGCSSFDVADITHDYIHPVPEKPVKLPYNFYLENLLDMRPKENDMRLIDHLSDRKQYTFKEDVFSNRLVRHINGKNLYDYDDALLRVELLDYAAFREKFHYTLSFYVDITGFDEKGKVIATGKFSCVSEKNEAVALFDKVKGVFKHDQDRQNDMKQQQQQVWNNLYDECLTNIAREFNNKVRLWGRG